MNGFDAKSGMVKHLSNRTNLTASKLMFTVCPICSLRFQRPPSHVARVAISTCSRACAAEASKVRVEVPCVVCGEIMERTPSDALKRTTCSKRCGTLRRVKNIFNNNLNNSAAYKGALKRICSKKECKSCGSNVGSWVVKNLKSTLMYTGEVVIEESHASLWCRRCHLASIAQSGGQSRRVVDQ